jgi:hypothetical protein
MAGSNNLTIQQTVFKLVKRDGEYAIQVIVNGCHIPGRDCYSNDIGEARNMIKEMAIEEVENTVKTIRSKRR